MTREDAQMAWERIVETGFSNYDHLTIDQKVWFNIESLTTGGIIDHYLNYGADHNQDTISALEYLGFYDIAELIRKVNSLFTNGQPPSDIEERNKEWDAFCEHNDSFLDEVDDIFFERSDDLESSLLEHINKTKIGIA